MRDIVSILIGEEVIKIRIKQFRGKRYESTRHGSITEKLNGSNSVKNGWNPRKMGVKLPFTRKMGGEYSPQLAKEEQLSVGASGDCSPTTLYFFLFN